MSILTLRDGRALDADVSGPDDGTALVFHHGTPGSLLPFAAVRRAAHARGLRLITYSRPGYGSSDRAAGRTIADAAADVAEVLDHLEIERCLTAGWSGGGPHALATGALLDDRVAGVLVMAGVGPYGVEGLDWLAGMGEQNIEESLASLRGEADLRAWLDTEGAALRHVTAEPIVAELSTLLPPADVAVLTDEFGADLAANFREALRTGVDGWLDDDLAFVAPWGFEFADLVAPVFVWQGDADLMVPFAHGRWLADHVPGVRPHLLPGEGHLSVVVGHLDDMFDELVAAL